jgi:hypothetical protein
MSITTPDRFGDFNASLMNGTLRDDMNNFWPPNIAGYNNPTFLWGWEWDRHGHHYARNIKRINATATNESLQHQYFQDSITFYRRFNFRKFTSGIIANANAFTTHTGIPFDHFIITCISGTSDVLEIHVCLSFSTNNVTRTSRPTRSSVLEIKIVLSIAVILMVPLI